MRVNRRRMQLWLPTDRRGLPVHCVEHDHLGVPDQDGDPRGYTNRLYAYPVRSGDVQHGGRVHRRQRVYPSERRPFVLWPSCLLLWQVSGSYWKNSTLLTFDHS